MEIEKIKFFKLNKKAESRFLLGGKKAAIGATLTWMVATIIIVFLVLIFLLFVTGIKVGGKQDVSVGGVLDNVERYRDLNIIQTYLRSSITVGESQEGGGIKNVEDFIIDFCNHAEEVYDGVDSSYGERLREVELSPEFNVLKNDLIDFFRDTEISDMIIYYYDASLVDYSTGELNYIKNGKMRLNIEDCPGNSVFWDIFLYNSDGNPRRIYLKFFACNEG